MLIACDRLCADHSHSPTDAPQLATVDDGCSDELVLEWHLCRIGSEFGQTQLNYWFFLFWFFFLLIRQRGLLRPHNWNPQTEVHGDFTSAAPEKEQRRQAVCLLHLLSIRAIARSIQYGIVPSVC